MSLIRTIIFCFLFCFSSFAAEGEWHRDSEYPFKLRLISDYNSVSADGFVEGAVEFDLGDEWKIYWRKVGDSGLPTRFDFSASENLRSADILWPVPQKLELRDIISNGYEKYIVFPFILEVKDKTQPLAINLTSDFLICAKLCIPITAHLRLDLGAYGGNFIKDNISSDIRQRFLSTVPQKVNSDLQSHYIGSDSKRHYYRLIVQGDENTEVFIENLGGDKDFIGIDNIKTLSSDKIQVEFSNAAGGVVADNLRLTLSERDLDGRFIKAWDIHSSVTELEGSEDSFTHNSWLIWLSLIGFSLLGGLILNIMPCVLPALALKIFAFSDILGSKKAFDKNLVRKSFLATAFGIVSCFLLLGTVLTVIKFFGGTVGWGVQYQQPTFLAILFMIMLLFSANLFGLFEVQLPQGIMVRVTRFLPPQQSGSHLGQDFLLGFLVTILATPCSAPFLSTALGVALIVGGFEGLIIFLLLGVGMAFPYFMVGMFPMCARFLPKPGSWIRVVKFMMGVFLLLTCVWLFWLLVGAHSLKVAIMVGVLTFGAIIYLYLRGKDILSFTSHVALLPSLMLLGGLFLTFSAADERVKVLEEDGYWRVFDESLIEPAIMDGKVVFVDVTADWCVTCKFNKFNVLHSSAVADKLDSADVLALRADWTLPDSSITSYLQRHGRAGVPLNVVYGVGALDGIILSEILTVSSVLSAFSRAGGEVILR